MRRACCTAPSARGTPTAGRAATTATNAGVLVAARAWQASGVPLGEAAARAQAVRDAEEDARYYATLDAIVDANLPGCDAGGVKT